MSIVQQKEKVFGNISILRTLTDDFPQLSINNSFPSITNQGNSEELLIDLILSLVGFEELKNVLIDVLTYAAEEAESIIKESLKLELKSIVACGIDPAIPTWMNTGIDIPITEIDFFNLFKTNPETQAGSLLYEDVAALTNSTDFNTFLYYTIQDQTVQYAWNNILEFTFTQNGPPNNMLNIIPTLAYNNLTNLNNDFIDSVTLFPSGQLITNIIDSLFGTISSNIDVNKSEKILETEGKIKTSTNCIVNADENEVVDDSFFNFSNPQLRSIKEEVRNRKQGVRQLKTCSTIDVNMPIGILTDFKTQFSDANGSVNAERTVISNTINTMSDYTATFAGQPVDQYSIKADFVGLMLKSITQAFVNSILGPKIVTIFLINYKIVYGQNATYGDPIEFLKQNVTLIKTLVDRIRDIIIAILLQKVLKHITFLIARNALEAQKEKGKAQLDILRSLVGIPRDVLNQINNISPISY